MARKQYTSTKLKDSVTWCHVVSIQQANSQNPTVVRPTRDQLAKLGHEKVFGVHFFSETFLSRFFSTKVSIVVPLSHV